jgi:hypothetical protein
MKVFFRLLDFYINSSIHVALAVCSLVVVTLFEFEIDVSKALLFFVFFGTITGYNFIKYAKIAGLHHRSLARSLKTIQIYSVIAGILMLYSASKLSLNALVAIGILGVCTLLYAMPLLYKKSFRDIAGLKIFMVAFVWASLTVVLPLIEKRVSIGLDQWITFFQRFIIVLVLIFPFEIRDLPYDSPSLRTLAQRLGVTKLVNYGYYLLAGVLVMEVLKAEISVPALLSLTLLNIGIGLMLYHVKTAQSKYFTTFWVEGLPIFWIVVLFLFRNLLM